MRATHIVGRAILAGIAGLSLCSVALAEQRSDDWMADRFSIAVGAFFPDTETVLRADSSNGQIGTEFSYEDQLKLGDSSASFDISVMWRIFKRHSIDAEYFDISRDGVTTLDAEIRFNDSVFAEQIEVDSFLDTSVFRIGYGYSLIHKENYELGLHAGLHVTTIDTGISVLFRSSNELASESIGTTAPLPVIGLYGAYRFGDSLLMYGRLQLFELEVGDYDGSMRQMLLGVEHATFDKVSLGLGYRFFEVDLAIGREEWNGAVDFKYNGPVAFMRVGFK